LAGPLRHAHFTSSVRVLFPSCPNPEQNVELLRSDVPKVRRASFRYCSGRRMLRSHLDSGVVLWCSCIRELFHSQGPFLSKRSTCLASVKLTAKRCRRARVYTYGDRTGAERHGGVLAAFPREPLKNGSYANRHRRRQPRKGGTGNCVPTVRHHALRFRRWFPHFWLPLRGQAGVGPYWRGNVICYVKTGIVCTTEHQFEETGFNAGFWDPAC
jgi:hypothetical protein